MTRSLSHLAVLLGVAACVVATRVQAEAATLREHRVRSLYDMARDLSAALLPEQVAPTYDLNVVVVLK